VDIWFTQLKSNFPKNWTKTILLFIFESNQYEMKGKLKKLEDGWHVLHSPDEVDGELWYSVTPLTVKDVLESEDLVEGMVVEVNIVKYNDNEEFAKLIKPNIETNMEIIHEVKEVTVKNPTKKITDIMNKEIKLPKINIGNADFKNTVTSFNNVFYGAMVSTVIAVIGMLFYAYGIYVLAVPVGYVVLCYVGKMVKPVLGKIMKDESFS